MEVTLGMVHPILLCRQCLRAYWIKELLSAHCDYFGPLYSLKAQTELATTGFKGLCEMALVVQVMRCRGVENTS